MADQETIGYVVTVYSGRGLPPERSDFEDKVKAEKAFTDAKFAATLWQSRPPALGLGWVKLKEKETPPPAPPAPPAAAKPAAPAAAAPVAKPAAVPAAKTEAPGAVAPKTAVAGPAAEAGAAAADAAGANTVKPVASPPAPVPSGVKDPAATTPVAAVPAPKPGTNAAIPKKPIDPLNDSTPSLKPPPSPAQVQKARMLKLMIEYLSAYNDGNFKAHSENLGKFLGATPGKNKPDMLAAVEAIEKDFDKGEMEWSTPAREFVKLAKEAFK